MADENKSKLQLRSGLAVNGDKTPSPVTKLLINHGKPNFTIQRSHNGNSNPLSPTPEVEFDAKLKMNNNNNSKEFVVKSTTFNGVFKPSNVSDATKQTLPLNGNSVNSSNNNSNENEAAKVVLRRAKVVHNETREIEEDENVPEFIRRQRRIQERLANQNILDFENRRSGYFTQVMISPSSPNRKSFVETMASPAVKPGLEIPPPTPQEDIQEEPVAQEQKHEDEQQQPEVKVASEMVELADPFTLNGQLEEEEVAKAIEEVNKAVEGEDDDKTDIEEHVEIPTQEAEQHLEDTAVAVTSLEHVEDSKPEKGEKHQEETPAVEETSLESAPVVAAVVTSALEVTQEQLSQENGHVEAVVTSAPVIEEKMEEPKTNGVVEEVQLQNGHSKAETEKNGITISHTNGLNGPSIPSPDPKGEKGVNFEPKTVVSFSQELGNDLNKYPDTVKVVKDVESTADHSDLKELTKLKFEIKADDQDIEVKPVLVNETS